MDEGERLVLDSGLQISVAKRRSPLSHFQLITPFGGDVLRYRDAESGEEVSLQPGSAHYFEHVLFIMPPLGRDGKPLRWRTNTPKRMSKPRDGLTELKHHGAIEVNAYTANDHTNYFFVTRQHPLENLETMLDFVFTPYLPQDRFRKECGTIGDEIARGENDSMSELFRLWDAQAHVKHGGRIPIIGTQESIRRITLDDVLSMHDTFYRPSNMMLIATGDVDAKAVADVVQRKLEALGKADYRPPPGEVSQEEPRGVVAADNFDSPLARADVSRKKMLGGWKYLLEPLSMRPEELIDLHVAAEIAATALYGMGSLNREALVRAGTDERTFTGYNWDFRDRGCIQVQGDCDDAEGFRSLVAENAAGLVAAGLPPGEVEYARNKILTDNEKNRESLLSFGQMLAYAGAQTRNPLDYFSILRRFKDISHGEVNALLPRLLDTANMTFALMVPERA